MSHPFLITRRDYAVLTSLMRHQSSLPARVAALMRDKARSIEIIPSRLVPPAVALLESRIRYRVGFANTEMRTLTADLSTAGLGMFLPISTERAVALLGLREGQSFSYQDAQGSEQTVLLEEVLYQRSTGHGHEVEWTLPLSGSCRKNA